MPKREDHELTAFEQDEKVTHGEAMARVRQATERGSEELGKQIEDRPASRRQCRPPSCQVDHDRSRAARVARETITIIRDNLNKGNTRLAELELEATKAENGRLEAQLDRRIKIEQLERKLAIDRNKMTRTSQVISQGRGHVAQILSAMDELVHEGAPVVLLHSDKSELGTDDVETSTIRSSLCPRVRVRKSS